MKTKHVKICPICKINKPIEDFRVTKIGRCSYCLDCERQYNIDYGKTPHRKYSKAKYNAKARGFVLFPKFSLWASHVYSPCVYCGEVQENGNSLDRIDNSKDYTDDNIVSCCYSCNTMKLSYSVQEFLNKCKK